MTRSNSNANFLGRRPGYILDLVGLGRSLLILAILCILLSGCSSEQGIQFDGFSIGVMRLDTGIEVFGQKSEIKEYVPIGLVNFSWK